MNDNTSYDKLKTADKVARNRVEIEAIIFKLGGKLSIANRLGYTDAWLSRALRGSTLRESEILVSTLRGLLNQRIVL